MADDTAPIRSEERFDEARVADYLKRTRPDLVGTGPIRFDQFPGGAANLTYRAVTEGGEYVLRRAPLGPTAAGGHDMAREHKVLSRLWRAFPEAPRSHLFCEDPDVMGKPFFMMDRRHGHVVRASWPIGEGRRRHVCEELVDALGRLHSVDPAVIDLADLGRPDGFVRRQVDGWRRRWDAAKTRDVPDMEAVATQLSAAIPEPQGATILHNDYKLDNTMIDDTGDLVAVFDWDMATLGDPLVDLGTTIAYWVDPDGPTAAVFGDRVRPLTPYMSTDEVASRYGAATGFDLTGIDWYVALALFRLAVILEQIYARYVRGQTTDERFAGFAPGAPLLARAAADLLG
jgi:aminoglycoside phosphotransferase (APT) family kinase protein